MPIFHTARMGRALLLAAVGLGATAAFAASDPQVVAGRAGDARSVAVTVSDLDLARPQDRDLLAIRVDNAARTVCDVHDSSRLDRLPAAQACLSDARSGALAQLGVRGSTAVAVLASTAIRN